MGPSPLPFCPLGEQLGARSSDFLPGPQQKSEEKPVFHGLSNPRNGEAVFNIAFIRGKRAEFSKLYSREP